MFRADQQLLDETDVVLQIFCARLNLEDLAALPRDMHSAIGSKLALNVIIHSWYGLYGLLSKTLYPIKLSSATRTWWNLLIRISNDFGNRRWTNNKTNLVKFNRAP